MSTASRHQPSTPLECVAEFVVAISEAAVNGNANYSNQLVTVAHHEEALIKLVSLPAMCAQIGCGDMSTSFVMDAAINFLVLLLSDYQCFAYFWQGLTKYVARWFIFFAP